MRPSNPPDILRLRREFNFGSHVLLHDEGRHFRKVAGRWGSLINLLGLFLKRERSQSPAARRTIHRGVGLN